MSESEETYLCGYQTRGVRYIDPEPAEYCMAEVENEDERCPAHDEEPDEYNPWGDD